MRPQLVKKTNAQNNEGNCISWESGQSSASNRKSCRVGLCGDAEEKYVPFYVSRDRERGEEEEDYNWMWGEVGLLPLYKAGL